MKCCRRNTGRPDISGATAQNGSDPLVLSTAKVLLKALMAELPYLTAENLWMRQM